MERIVSDNLLRVFCPDSAIREIRLLIPQLRVVLVVRSGRSLCGLPVDLAEEAVRHNGGDLGLVCGDQDALSPVRDPLGFIQLLPEIVGLSPKCITGVCKG